VKWYNILRGITLLRGVPICLASNRLHTINRLFISLDFLDSFAVLAERRSVKDKLIVKARYFQKVFSVGEPTRIVVIKSVFSIF
jgi:hypothetical protein